MRAPRVLWVLLVIAIFATLGSMPAAAQTWQVMSADYGIKSNRVDVTNTVRRLVNGPDFRVNNSTMGIDPARGADKVLRIHARAQNGQMRDFAYNEGQTVNARMFTGGGFPGGGYPGGGYPGTNPGRNLRIVQASYGAGNRRRDVTGRLQSLVRNNRLSVLVNNTTMGGDPAFNQAKDVMVTYDFQGRTRTTTTREGNYLNLP